MKRAIVGIDVGGTFTDFILLKDGALSIHKLPSTPSDPSRSVIQGLEEMGAPPDSAKVHGSTVATNALLERKGSRAALITTAGFEDVLEIGRQNRSSLYDLMMERPQALVPQDLRFGALERVGHTGQIIRALSPVEVRRLAAALEAASVEAVAVSLLFSFLNPTHEEMIKEALASLSRKPFLSISSEVLPEFREYERTSTVAVNAYVGPVVARYLERLGQSIGSFRIMQSSGGSISAESATRQPVRLILSGPAGGVVGAFYVASRAGFDQIVTFDMGGTSTDVSLCPGHIQETTSSAIGGSPLSVPMIDIHTVGAGGGSIARLDEGGALLVGPESAGADPGPACYGRGEAITVTDANLLLGRMDPQHFLGGRMALDYQRPRRLMAQLAQRLGASETSAAEGIVRVVNSNMERAIRAISLERGFDPRDFTLVAFGGAGPMHACELAQELSIPRVLVPLYPGVLSALGVAIADLTKDYSQTIMLHQSLLTEERLEEALRELEERGWQEMLEEGLPHEAIASRRLLDLRYVGQSYELTVDCPDSGDRIAQAIQAFHQAHQRRFGYSDPRLPVELVNARIKMVGRVEKPELAQEAPGEESPAGAFVEERGVVFQGEARATSVYDRDRMHCGNVISGPAVIFQMDATTVIPPDWVATVDAYGNLVVEVR